MFVNLYIFIVIIKLVTYVLNKILWVPIIAFSILCKKIKINENRLNKLVYLIYVISNATFM